MKNIEKVTELSLALCAFCFEADVQMVETVKLLNPTSFIFIYNTYIFISKHAFVCIFLLAVQKL